LGVACKAIRAFPSCMAVVTFAVLISVVWTVIWAFSVAGVAEAMAQGSDDDSTALSGGVLFLLLISFYWGGMVISNLAHVTVSGAVAEWWFVSPSALALDSRSSTVVGRALCRALSSSFGSICLGSFIVAFLASMRALLRSMHKANRILACCVDCFLAVIEGWMMYVNRFAFVYIAIYGDDFMTAGRRVNGVFSNRGFWNTIVNDWVLSTVLSIGAFGIAVTTAAFAWALGAAILHKEEHAAAVAFAGFLCGGLIATATMGALDSAVATVYVAFGEDPRILKDNHPQAFHELYDAWNTYYPEVITFVILA